MVPANTKKINKIGRHVVTSNIGEKTQFTILMAPYRALKLMPMKKKFMVEISSAHEITRSKRDYTSEELASDTYEKSVQKLPIT